VTDHRRGRSKRNFLRADADLQLIVLLPWLLRLIHRQTMSVEMRPVDRVDGGAEHLFLVARTR